MISAMETDIFKKSKQSIELYIKGFIIGSVSICSERGGGGRQRRQEETHAPNLQRATDLRFREDVRADKVPGRT